MFCPVSVHLAYQRRITLTPNGVIATETTTDPDLTAIMPEKSPASSRHASQDRPDDGRPRNDGFLNTPRRTPVTATGIEGRELALSPARNVSDTNVRSRYVDGPWWRGNTRPDGSTDDDGRSGGARSRCCYSALRPPEQPNSAPTAWAAINR